MFSVWLNNKSLTELIVIQGISALVCCIIVVLQNPPSKQESNSDQKHPGADTRFRKSVFLVRGLVISCKYVGLKMDGGGG